jgi:hypothetical protein
MTLISRINFLKQRLYVSYILKGGRSWHIGIVYTFQISFTLRHSDLLLCRMVAEHFLPTAPRACINTKLCHSKFSAYRIGPYIHTHLVNKIIYRVHFKDKHFRAQWLHYYQQALQSRMLEFNSAFVSVVSVSEKAETISLTGFYNRESECLLLGTN